MRAALFEGDGGGEVEALDAAAEFLMGVFVEAEAETGHVDECAGETRGAADGFEEFLLLREADVAEPEKGADEKDVGLFFDDGNDGEVLGAADVDAHV